MLELTFDHAKSLRRSAGFVARQLTGSTLATKQPANTAAALATLLVSPSRNLCGLGQVEIPLAVGATENNQQRLQQLRDELLRLHKTLVDSERVTYEQTIGAISSPNQFLQLLTRDPWFGWLQSMSQLIVVMDEALDAKDPLTIEGVDSLFRQTQNLIVASEQGEGFSRHYYDALQRDPDVVLAHAALARVLGARKTQA